MKNYTDSLFEDLMETDNILATPYYQDILNGNFNWAAIKYYGIQIAATYGSTWSLQSQYMINAYIGESNDKLAINTPRNQVLINEMIANKCKEDPSITFSKKLSGIYKFNNYPNNHEKFDIAEFNLPLGTTVSDIIRDETAAGIIYDIDAKNTAEGGIGFDHTHNADMIMYNNQDTGDIDIYIAKTDKRTERKNFEQDYVKIGTLPGPKNYKRIIFVEGFPRLVDFSLKLDNNGWYVPNENILPMLEKLKAFSIKNKDYVSANITTGKMYGETGKNLVINYTKFIDTAIDIISYKQTTLDRKNKAGQNLFELQVVYVTKDGSLAELAIKNLTGNDLAHFYKISDKK